MSDIDSFNLFIHGKEVPAESGETIESFNPIDGKVWANIARARAADVEKAVESSYKALWDPAWRGITASHRGALLRRVGDLILENAERLATLEVKDNGKLMAEMLGQLRYIPQYFYYYGGLADKVEGAVIPSEKQGMFVYTEHEPVGVVAAITPWNSPLLLTTWKLAPALAAGCTMVIKPSEHASTSMIEFAKLFIEAGFPPGVVNVLTGYGQEVGEPLVAHDKVDRVAFTGGEFGGKAVYKAAAEGLKGASLELGGKSPNVICEDADIAQVVKGAVSGIFAAAGQTCMAGSRVLVHEKIHDEFVRQLVEFTKAARVGDPFNEDTNIGPVATNDQLKKVLNYVDIAKSEGAECAYGGNRLSGGDYGDGWFVEPTIFTNVRNEMRIAQEEVFGPILSVIKFSDDDEAIRIANDTPYGLAAAVWTNDVARAFKFSKALQAGTVWVNAYRVVSYTTPFGGFKQSGIGREGGQEMIKEYLQTKSVFVNLEKEIPNPFVLR